MKYKVFVSVAALCVAACSVYGEVKEYFVDGAKGSDLTQDGTNSTTPYKTIQAAVDKAASGDIVTVMPGNYGPCTSRESGLTDTAGNHFSVYLTKNITLRSKEGAQKTHIYGAACSAEAENQDTLGLGMGDDAVRCVSISSAAAGCRVEGFTIRDGHSRHISSGTDCDANRGGGIFSQTMNATYVDLVVSNNVATRGAGIRYGTAVRTLIADNTCDNNGAAARNVNLYWCLVTRNVGGSTIYCDGAKLVNTTIVGNYMAANNVPFRGNNDTSRAYIYNCVSLFYAQEGWTTAYVTISNSLYQSDATVYYKTSSTPEFRTNGCVQVANTSKEFYSPLTGDWRPIEGSAMVALGDAGCLNEIPEEFRYKDFAGRAVDKSAPLQAGCYQEVITPTSGTIEIRDTAYGANSAPNVTVNGMYSPIGGAYLRAEAWPKQFQVKYVPMGSGKYVFFALRCNDGTDWNYWPERDGSVWVLPPKAAGDNLVLKVQNCQCEHIFWADATVAADAEQDGSEDKPYRVLQDAVNKATDGGSNYIIKVKPGHYNEGGETHYNTMCRVSISGVHLFMTSTEGPEKTFIEGAADDTTGAREDNTEGLGPNAVRCCYVNSSHVGISGFTFKDGHAGYDVTKGQTSDSTTLQGGAIFSEGRNAQVLDSVFTNCVASRGAVSRWATLQRCHLTGCESTRLGVTRFSRLVSCLIENCGSRNPDDDNLLGGDCWTYNCTFVGDGTHKTMTDESKSSATHYVHANDLYVNFAQQISIDNSTLSGDWCYNIQNPPVRWNGLKEGEIFFRDADNWDFRMLNICTDVINGGKFTDVQDEEDVLEDYRLYISTDLNGKPLNFTAAGTPIPGCIQDLAPAVYVKAVDSTQAEGAAAGSAGIKLGDGTLTSKIFYDTAAGESITLTATDTATRPFLGFEVNGVFQAVTAAPYTWTYTFSADDAAAGAIWSVKAIYSNAWYVSPTGNNEENTGWTSDAPLRTLAGAMAKARSGDTVWALPGYYEEGDDIQTSVFVSGTPSLRARVVVKEGVTLESVDGPESTFIMGKSATQNADEYGRGEDALRCAALLDKAILRGFTLTGGRVLAGTTENDNYRGAGVISSADYLPLVENCIISNNIAERAGGACYITAANCKFLKNKVLNNGAAARSINAYNCLFDYNEGSNALGYWFNVVNCTFGAHNFQASGTYQLLSVAPYNSDSKYAIVNSLFLDTGTISASDKMTVVFTNCVFNESYRERVTNHPISTNVFQYGCKFAAASELQVDDLCRPILGANVAIDAGTNALYRTHANCVLTNVDLAGAMRIANRTIDAGCYEVDWKARYAADLGDHLGTVTKATWDTLETPERAVELIDGAAIDYAWGENSTACKFTYGIVVKVIGAGTLKVKKNGADWQTLSATEDTTQASTWTFKSTEKENTLSFAFSGNATAKAEIVNAFRETGTVIFIR